ncbi:hypothetical protein HUJ04_010807 [Dendroctonus ponderosae]|nr:hypothetical protein HUJ04_010807 [Dendroctonus ponderosae]
MRLIINVANAIAMLCYEDTSLEEQEDHNSGKSVAHYEHDPIMSNFMFLAKNPRWKAVRSKLTPVFSTGKLKQMFPHILREGNLMVDYISNFDNMPSIESKEICAKFSTNVIARCAFAIDAGCFNTENAEFREQMYEWLDQLKLIDVKNSSKPDQWQEGFLS